MNDIENILREDFEAFFIEAFAHTHPHIRLEFTPYLKFLTARFQLIRKRDRLIINQPPRTLKSWTAKFFVAWYMGRHPRAEVMIVANTQNLAEKIIYDIRAIMRAPWYRQIFPAIEILRSVVDRFETSRGGSLYGTSVESSIGGHGADLIIVDDPNKIEDARRPDRLAKVNEKFDGEIYSRLNDKRRSIVLVIQHRLAENDLSGHLINEGYKKIVFPLIAPRKKKYRLPDGRIWVRPQDDILTHTYTRRDVDQARKTSSPPFEWFYQQGAGISQETRLKPEHFRLEKHPFLTGAPVISIDTAQRSGPLNSFNVLQIWQTTHDGRHHLVDQFRRQCGFAEFANAALHIIRRTRPAVVLIEEATHGGALLSWLMERIQNTKFIAVEPRESKAERLDRHRSLIRRGQISLPANAEWVNEYVAEFVEFPAEHTDCVDATTQHLDFATTNPILEAPPPRALGVLAGSNTTRLPQQTTTGGNTRGTISLALGSRFRRRFQT
jgi:predicted phage terminase large subunit-like protein